MRILIIEDDKRIASNVAAFLKNAGYQTAIAENGEDGLFEAEEGSYDAVILDWMLPDRGGVEVCLELRKNKKPVPVLMLTAKSQVEDKVEGLNAGADDYLTKPFSSQELLARVKSLIRRASNTPGMPVIRVDDLSIDTNTTVVTKKGKVVNLTPKEYDLLVYLASKKGEIVDRMTLLENVWGEEIDPLSNTIDVHIRYLRRKIETGNGKKLIVTVKNKGYMLCKA